MNTDELRFLAAKERSGCVNQCSSVVPSWAASYVGIPFRSRGRDRSGCDCYGLLALVLSEVFHLEVPSYAADYLDATDAEEIAALIAGEIGSRWHRMEPQINTDEHRSRSQNPLHLCSSVVTAGDAIVLRIAGRAWHVGIVISVPSVAQTLVCDAPDHRLKPVPQGEGWFLHTRPGTGSCLERFDSLRWARRIVGFYRYGG
jgi:cell wall-associated NlpC family hydrolase